MHELSVIIQQPANASLLVLLFHGVGSTAANLAPLGDAIANAFPNTAVVSVDAPHASTLGSGREWFSVVGITEQDRPARIAQAMPIFSKVWGTGSAKPASLRRRPFWLASPRAAIMSLESTQTGDQLLAARVVSLAGRFAIPVRSVPPGLKYHLIHGAQDGVVAPQFAQQASAQIAAMGGAVTLDMLEGLGHSIDARALAVVLLYLGDNEQ